MKRHRPKTLASVAVACATALLVLPGCSLASNIEGLFGSSDTQSSEGPRSTVKKPSAQGADVEEQGAGEKENEQKQETQKEQKVEAVKPAELVIDSACDAMNTTAFDEATRARANLGVTAPIENTDMWAFEAYAGQVAQATAGQATRYSACFYPVYLHNVVTQYIFDVTPSVQGPLIEALRADPTIIDKSSGNVLHFVFQQDTPGQGGTVAKENVNYIFMGNAWIAIFDNGGLDYAPAAIDGLRAANPTL